MSGDSANQLLLAVLSASAGIFLLLPKPRLRHKSIGTVLSIASLGIFLAWSWQRFGEPTATRLETALFTFFSLGALINGVVLVVQRNPARGAISFAFVILSVSGLFLLLAAPFLMAATIIVYAGAIIVTFLFALMLSRAAGPTDENDRTREPMLGSLAGFAFAGLILFALHLGTPYPTSMDDDDNTHQHSFLPAPILTSAEQKLLSQSIHALEDPIGRLSSVNMSDENQLEDWLLVLNQALVPAFKAMDSAEARLLSSRIQVTKDIASSDPSFQSYVGDSQAVAFKKRMDATRQIPRKLYRNIQEVQDQLQQPDFDTLYRYVVAIRDELRLLHGSSQLPARTVANLGLTLYSDHLLSVELAGMLLLVATVGAVSMAQRREAGR